MAKSVILNGAELAGFIEERQFHELRSQPRTQKMVIVTDHSSPASEAYMRIKQKYGSDVGVRVEVMEVSDSPVEDIQKLNNDPEVGGVIVQLPFREEKVSESLINELDIRKDIDGLKLKSHFHEPTVTAILWLIAGYNIDLNGKSIAVVGNGRLVGKPLVKALDDLGHTYRVIDENASNVEGILRASDVIISGVGKPEIIKSEWIKPGTVVVDAGVASENGVLKGDVEEIARERHDISITPIKGGVGPLTVCALFDNFLRATV